MKEKILLVDDEPNILQGYQRQLRKLFSVETAGGAAEGLKRIRGGGAFAVVLSDLRMPEMDGVQFLAEVRRHAPATVRIMISGNADLETCIDAVNEGSIFRFLTKPCPTELLVKTLEAGVEQYRLTQAEKELLHCTLSGTIGLLTDIMSVMNPAAFSRSSRIRRYVRHVAAELNLDHFWHYDMAAALSQIGLVALPPEILDRLNAGRVLAAEQRRLVARYPEIGCELLGKIPRLELVAQMVSRQNKVERAPIAPGTVKSESQIIAFGALVLRVSLELDQLMLKGKTFLDALRGIQTLYGPDHPVVEALMSLETRAEDSVVMEIMASDLSSGMVAVEDIVNHNGHVVVAKGQRITEPVIYHLQSCAQESGIREPFLVEVLSAPW